MTSNLFRHQPSYCYGKYWKYSHQQKENFTLTTVFRFNPYNRRRCPWDTYRCGSFENLSGIEHWQWLPFRLQL